MSTISPFPLEKTSAAERPLSHAYTPTCPIRVAVITEDIRPPLDEGAKKTVFHLIRALRKNGTVVSLFTRRENPLVGGSHPLPGNKTLLGLSFLRSLRRQSPDVILYIPTSSGTAGAFLRAGFLKMQSRGVPLVLLSLQYRAVPRAARYLGLARCADAVLTQSPESLRVFRSLGCKTVLLPGAVDGSIFQPVSLREKQLLRSRYGFLPSDRIVLHAGHINRDRNVRVFAGLVEQGYRVVLVASTSTPADPVLLADLRQAGVQVITGYVENIQHYYQMADCYLFPVFQAFSAIDAPLSVLEAMACNLPVVTTPFGALPGMFRPEHGLAFVHTNEEMIPAVKEAVAQATIARQNIRTCDLVAPFTWDRVAANLLETLQGVTYR